MFSDEQAGFRFKNIVLLQMRNTEFLCSVYPSVQDILTDRVLNLHVFGFFVCLKRDYACAEKCRTTFP